MPTQPPPSAGDTESPHSGDRLRHRVALRRRMQIALHARLSPERTRRATLLERLTVQRLSWTAVVRLNRWLALLGKIATVVWCAVIASLVLGVDVKSVIRHAFNSGAPLKSAAALAIILPTLAFLGARSMIG